MTDETTTLRDVLDAYEPVSFAEHQTIEPAQIFVRPGIDPVDILDDLERKRETVGEWTTLEQEQGIAEVWRRYGREIVSGWRSRASSTPQIRANGSWTIRSSPRLGVSWTPSKSKRR